MRIHQMPEGARFEYQGQEYVKTGPLVATGLGGSRFIPKHAVLKPIGDVQPLVEKSSSDPLPRGQVLAAFNGFSAQCRAFVPEERQGEFDAACRVFIRDFG